MAEGAPAIYLDYAAATPLDPEVAAAMKPYQSTRFYNPSATYQAAREIRKEVSKARAEVASWLGSKPNEIIFTAGGSEANNLAIHGVMRTSPETNVVISAIEHDSVRAPAQRYDCRTVSVQPDGRLDLAALRSSIDERTALVSIMYANNEIGTVQDVKDVTQIITELRGLRSKDDPPLLFHIDACQAVDYLDMHVSRLGADLITVNGGKIYGPKQSGALYVRSGSTLQPLIDGGGQEQGLRSGTENVAGIIGLAKALTKAQASRKEEAARMKSLQEQFFSGLQSRVPQATINGSRKYRLPNNVHITLPGSDNERLLIQLDERGIQAAAGSACSASSDVPSRVLRAIGLTDEQARASLRFSMGRGTTPSDIERTITVLQSVLH